MSVDLANAIARRYIARSDAKARQGSDGEYRPVREDPRDPHSATVKWSQADVLAHLEGTDTFGHYFLDHDNSTKLFALDIDLEEHGRIPTTELNVHPDITEAEITAWENSFAEGDPRASWRNRAYPGRNWMKSQFRMIAGQLASKVHQDLGLETAVAYSGHKGIHVYGFTGRCSAAEAREGAELVLELMGDFELVPTPTKRYISPRFPHLGVEVYPKQNELPAGGFGNLMRLPLGVNTKSPKDPTFFVDLRAPIGVLAPVDPLWSLTDGAKNPWADQ